MKRILGFALLALTALAAQAAPAPNTLGKIKAAKAITIAYAPDSVPFSADTKDGKPAGYSIDLCNRVVAGIQKQLGLADLKVNWVAGGTAERLAMVAQGKVDMECGVTTVTLSRQEKVDFSDLVFLEAGSVIARSDAGVRSLRDLGGKKVGVVAGTTTEKRIPEAFGKLKVMAEVVPFKDRADAFAALEGGKLAALAGDRVTLIGLVSRSGGDPGRYGMLEEELSAEPYGFALRRGDPDFRLAVNRAIVETYRSGEISDIFERWFAPMKPTGLLKAMIVIYGIQD